MRIILDCEHGRDTFFHSVDGAGDVCFPDSIEVKPGSELERLLKAEVLDASR